MSSSFSVCVMRSSMLILPSMYQSTMRGTSVRPRAPPNAVPFHTRPVTSWNGRVAISCPAPATPMITLTPQPHVAHALEAVVRATAGELDEVRDEVALHVARVHEVCHPERTPERLAR